MYIGELVIPLGIATYSFALITLIGGLRKIKIAYHKLLGIVTLVLATLHASLVIYLRFF